MGIMAGCFKTGHFPTIRNFMAGILLGAGPIATVDSVKKSSRMFLFAISKNKFESAATKLQALNLGELKHLSGKHRQSAVFIKKLPMEVEAILAREDCQDLCTIEEYQERFVMPSPGSIKDSLKNICVMSGWLAAEHFIFEQPEIGIKQDLEMEQFEIGKQGENE